MICPVLLAKHNSHPQVRAHIVVAKAHPVDEVRRHRQDVSQHVDLEFVKVLVHGGVQQCFEFV